MVPALGLVTLSAAHGAVSLTISPPSITNDYSGKIQLAITGLAPGQPVQVKRFYDVNGDGLIQAGTDFVLQSFKVTDGQQLQIGGVRNLNVPGDDDGLTNGQIITRLAYPGVGGPVSAMTGHFIFKLEDASGTTLATQVYSVVQKVQAQGVRGRLTSAATSLALTNSPLALIDPSGAARAVAGRTDTNGDYTFYAPAGSYSLVSLNSGYVADEVAGSVTVTAGQFVTNNLALLSGTQSISGTLTDAVTGKPGGAVFISGESTNHLFCSTFTDTNGFFSLPVTASQWKVKLDEAALAEKSYLKPQNSLQVTITNGNFTNANMALVKATALIYGTVRDSSSNAVNGVQMVADDSLNIYEAKGLTATNGAYTLGVLAGNWSANPNGDALIAAGYSGGGSTNLFIATGQAIGADFVLQSVTAHLRGQIKDNHGNPIPSMQLVVQPYPLQGNGANSLYPTTDENGNFDVGVHGGIWNLALECISAQSRAYVDISGLNYAVTDGVDQNGLTPTFPQATAMIQGQVTDPVGNPIVGVTVSAYQPISTNSSYDPGCVSTDSNGYYQLGVLNGNWTVSLQNDELNAQGYNAIFGTNITIVAGSGTANFVAPVTLTTPQFKGGGFSPTNGSWLIIAGVVAHTNTVQFSANLVTWFTLTNRVLTNSIWQVADPAAVSQRQRFYRVLAVP